MAELLAGWSGMRRRHRWALVCFCLGFLGVLLVYGLS